MTRAVFTVLLFLLASESVPAQTLFSNPLLIPPVLSGSFAEIRSNHFHSGIDLRTNETEGLPVLAAADGYISRIKVSASGFGNVIYLKHPSGLTSVYAHLYRFNETLEKLVEAEQYKKKSFEVELFPAEGSLPVTQGQMIGFSGNTGYSAGPHLHFEIRDSKTEMPFNPLSKLNALADTLSPVIRNIMLIDYAPFHQSYYPVSKIVLPVHDPEVNLSNQNDTLSFTSVAGIAVETYDRMNDSNADLGIQRIILKVNGKVVFHFEVDQFAFSETRLVNACIDYPEMVNEGKNFILLHHLPGNDFSALRPWQNAGLLEGEEHQLMKCEVSVADFNGNSASRTFYIRKTRQKALPVFPESNRYIAFNKTPVVQNDYVRIDFPAGTVTYNVHDFECIAMDSSVAAFSAFVKAGSPSIPLHQPCTLFIKTKNLPSSLQSKAIIVRLTDKNELISMGGVFQEGWVKTTVRTLGNFLVVLDTVKPEIKPAGVSEDGIWQRNKLTFKLSDDLSGIDQYEMMVDGQWVPARYDAKSGELTYIIPSGQKASGKQVKVTATDRKGNKSISIGSFNF